MAHTSLFRSFLSYYRGQRGLFAADLACALVVAAVDLAFPQVLRVLVNGAFAEGPATILAVLPRAIAILLALYLLRFAAKYFVVSWGHIMGARMESRMRQDLFDAYERQSMVFFARNKSGDLVSRLVGDLFDISEAAHHGPEFVLIGAVEVLGAFAIMSTINVPLTLVLVVVLVVVVAYDVWANTRMRAVFAQNRVRIAGVNSRLEDALTGVRVTKSFAAEKIECDKFRTSNEAYLDSKACMYKSMGRYQAGISALMGGLNVTIVGLGGWLIAQGSMQVGDLATFALYISLFTVPIENILNFTETLQRALAGFERFEEVLNTVPDVRDAPDAQPLVVTNANIRYEGVSFAYPDDEAGRPVIRNLDLHVAPGTTVALVGPSGGGKSTTCALLSRFYDVDAGRITIDGQDVRTVTQESLRRSIGLVQQEVHLFDGTIAENIAYGNPGASDNDIADAARAANLADLIAELPEGIHTQVGERGTRLSGGQRQRIAIARAFLKNPPILVLDEATSALDNESERKVQESLARLAKGRTTMVIAHRLSTIRDADLIATIEDGRVVELGTHDELLAANGTYARYYHMQFGT